MKYKVGDKVRVVNDECFGFVEKGDIGIIKTISDYKDGDFELKIDFGKNGKEYFQWVSSWNEDCIELVNTKKNTTNKDDNLDALEYALKKPTFIAVREQNKLVLVEDGTLREGDIDKLERFGFVVVVYKQGHRPKFINLK